MMPYEGTSLYAQLFGENTRTTNNIFTATVRGDCDEIRRLIKGGTDVNQADEYGSTPSMLAAFFGYSKMPSSCCLTTEQIRIRQPKTA